MANRHTHKKRFTTALATVVKKVKGIIESQLHQRERLKLKMLFFKKLKIGMKFGRSSWERQQEEQKGIWGR